MNEKKQLVDQALWLSANRAEDVTRTTGLNLIPALVGCVGSDCIEPHRVA